MVSKAVVTTTAMRVWRTLSAQEKNLVTHFLDTGDEVRALVLAGYGKGMSAVDRRRVFNDNRIEAAIYHELASRVKRGAAIGQRVLEEIAQDKDAPASVRVQSAIALRHRFLAWDEMSENQSKLSENQSKSLSECTVDELHALVDRLESERSGQARDITPCADKPALDAQVIDMIDGPSPG